MTEDKTELQSALNTISNITNNINLPGEKGISLEIIDLVRELRDNKFSGVEKEVTISTFRRMSDDTIKIRVEDHKTVMEISMDPQDFAFILTGKRVTAQVKTMVNLKSLRSLGGECE